MQRIVQLTDDEWVPIRSLIEAASIIHEKSAAGSYRGAMNDPSKVEPARLLATDLKALIDCAQYTDLDAMSMEGL